MLRLRRKCDCKVWSETALDPSSQSRHEEWFRNTQMLHLPHPQKPYSKCLGEGGQFCALYNPSTSPEVAPNTQMPIVQIRGPIRPRVSQRMGRTQHRKAERSQGLDFHAGKRRSRNPCNFNDACFPFPQPRGY